MKPGSNQRRSRGRGNNNGGGGNRRPNRNQSYDSNGPDVKVRGTAQQVLDKYMQLARDSQSSGDRVKAEAYLQFAEHYYRILSADQESNERAQRQTQNPDQVEPSEQGEKSEKVSKDEGAKAEQAAPDRQERPTRGRRRTTSAKNEATLAAEAAARNAAGDGDKVGEAVVESKAPAAKSTDDENDEAVA